MECRLSADCRRASFSRLNTTFLKTGFELYSCDFVQTHTILGDFRSPQRHTPNRMAFLTPLSERKCVLAGV